MSYSDLLRDPRWQRKRLEVLERADFKCEECGDATTTLHVHHTYYVKGRMPWHYENDSLRCLCEPCHEHVTEVTAKLNVIAGRLSLSASGVLLGVARAFAAEEIGGGGPLPIRVDDLDVAYGVALLYRVNAARLLTASQVGGGMVDRNELREWSRALRASNGASAA